jgi:hypothetical protein
MKAKKIFFLTVLFAIALGGCKKHCEDPAPSCITAVRTDGLVDRSVSVGAQDVELIEFVLTSSVSDTVYSLEFEGLGVNDFNGKLTANLYVDNILSRTATYRSGKFSFQSLKVATGTKVAVKGNFSSNISLGSDLALKLLSLTSKSGATLCGSIQGAKITTLEISPLTITAKQVSPKLIPGGSLDVELGRFETESIEPVELREIVFNSEVSIENRLTNVRLYDAQTGNYISASSNINNEKFSFKLGIYLPKGRKYWLIKADINNVLNVGDGGEFSVRFESVEAIKWANGQSTNAVFNGTVVGVHKIVRGAIATTFLLGSDNRNILAIKVGARGNRIRLQMLEVGLKNDGDNSAQILLSRNGYGQNELGSFNITNTEDNLLVLIGGLEIQAGQEIILYITMQGFQNGGTPNPLNGEIKVNDIIYEDIYQDGNDFIDGIWTFAGTDTYQVGIQPVKVLRP